LPECSDVWSNEWCQARKAEGNCHQVLLKCMGTCGGCCLDDAGKEQCDKMLADEVCHVQATGGYGEEHVTDCLETCGACNRELPVGCSFEGGEEGADNDGNNEQATCLLSRWTPANTGQKFSLKTFGAKKWTGPRYAYDGERFAILDTEHRAPGEEAWLTTPWGSVTENQIVTFEYSMFTRDFPDAMGTLEVEALVSHENKGYRSIWSETKAHDHMEWQTALVEVGEAACGEGHHHHDEMVMEDEDKCMPIRLRFRAITGASELSDIAIDNIQLLTRVCGDGKRTYEACDDGNTMDGDGCSHDCKVEAGYGCFDMGDAPDTCRMLGCGDGIITGDETCDDGNMMGGDGCSEACQVEEGHWCDHEPGKELDHHLPKLGQYLSFPGPSTCEPVYEGKPRLVGADALRSEPWEMGEWRTPDGPTAYANGYLELFSYRMSLPGAQQQHGGEYKAACDSEGPVPAEGAADPYAALAHGHELHLLADAACRELGYAVGRPCVDASPEDEPDLCAKWAAAHPDDAEQTMCSAGTFTTCKGHLPADDDTECQVGGSMLDGSYVSRKEMDRVHFLCPKACGSCASPSAGSTRRGNWGHVTECVHNARSIDRGCEHKKADGGECDHGALYVQCYHPNVCGDGRRSPHEIFVGGRVALEEDAEYCRAQKEMGNCKHSMVHYACPKSCDDEHPVLGRPLLPSDYDVDQDAVIEADKEMSCAEIAAESAQNCAHPDILAACPVSCRAATGPHPCDDGNLVDGDGCNSDCAVEDGWHCDGGSWSSADTCVVKQCGDGRRIATEQCDDGNDVSGDGCSSTCEVEKHYVCVGDNDEIDGDLTPAGKSTCYKIGTLKLLDQPTGPQGTGGEPIVGSAPLLVMSAHGWGSVCFGDFDIHAATVACQDLANIWLEGRAWYVQSPGFRKAHADEFAGRVLPTRLSATCAGDEAQLYDCAGAEASLHAKRATRCHNEKVHLTCSTDP